MRVIERTSGSQSTSSTHTVVTLTEPGTYSFDVDLSPLANGDSVYVYAQGKVLTGSTSRLLTPKWAFQHAQAQPNIVIGPFQEVWNLELHIDKIGGTTRTIDWSAREHLGDGVARKGTAQAGANGSITLDSGASATNDLYKGDVVTVIGGTGVGQSRVITGYTGSSKVAAVAPNWAVNPDSTSVFAVTSSQAKQAMVEALGTDTYAELAAVPAATSSLKDKLNWLFALARNKQTVTSAGVQTLRNDADSGSIGSSTVSDSGTTLTRGEWG